MTADSATTTMPATAAEPPTEALDPRLRTLVSHVTEGAGLGISDAAIGSHTTAIFERLGVSEHVPAIADRVRTGLIR